MSEMSDKCVHGFYRCSTCRVGSVPKYEVMGQECGMADIFQKSGANPKQACGDKKLPIHRVPPALVLYAAMGLRNGAKKYGPFNWREMPVEAITYYAAALRHLFAWFDGEDVDPDSKNPHLAHAIASLAILVDAIENKKVVDNRPKEGPAADIIALGTTETAGS